MPLALIVSPVRSWPLSQGNRARVLAMGRMLQERGYRVHFLLSEAEGRPAASDMEMMRRQWDLFQTIPYTHQRVQSYADAWGADDWYDPALDAAVDALCRVWSYDLCLVNYAWYSRAFDRLPRDVVRVLDTHDAFGDRHKRLHAAGTTPGWYYTRPADEAMCLERADHIIAIQETEKAWFESLTDHPIRTVGHVAQSVFLPPMHRRAGPLRAGYLASANPSNVVSISMLIELWAMDPFLSSQVSLHLAGSICQEVEDGVPFIVKHGFVSDVRRFYQGVDFTVNPNVGGSGLKIKSVEALSYGRPLFSTAEGMLGICGVADPFVVPDLPQMVAHMVRHLQESPDLAAATRWACDCYLKYRSRQMAGFEALMTDVSELRHRRLTVTGPRMGRS